MLFIGKINRKLLLIISLAVDCACLFTFTVTRNMGFLYFNRLVIGAVQVKLCFKQSH